MNRRLMLLFKCFIKPFEGLHVIIAPLFDWMMETRKYNDRNATGNTNPYESILLKCRLKNHIVRTQFIPVSWVYCIYIQSNAGSRKNKNIAKNNRAWGNFRDIEINKTRKIRFTDCHS